MHIYLPSLENGSIQLIVTLYKLSIYPFVYKKLIRTLFEARIIVTLRHMFQNLDT